MPQTLIQMTDEESEKVRKIMLEKRPIDDKHASMENFIHRLLQRAYNLGQLHGK